MSSRQSISDEKSFSALRSERFLLEDNLQKGTRIVGLNVKSTDL